jgi:hypothetical protein
MSQFLLAFYGEMISIPQRRLWIERMLKEQAVMNKKKQVLIVTNAMTNDEVLEIKSAFQAKLNHSQNALNSEYSAQDISLSLVHVIPRLPTCYFSIPSMGTLVEKYYDEAKQSLTQVGKHLGVAKKDQWLISGTVRTEVLRLAQKIGVMSEFGSGFILASAHMIKELQRSLFFKNIHQYAVIKNVTHLKRTDKTES